MTTPAELLDSWLAERLEPTALDWLRSKVDGARKGGVDASFFLAVSSVPRKLGRAGLALSATDLARASKSRPGFQPGHWTVDQAARTLLVLALPVLEQDVFVRTLDRLFTDGDLGELVALYQALPLLPEPEAHRARAAEGVRSNMQAVFEAVALRNPYPAEQLDDAAFNQLVLKCLFLGSPLYLVQGIDRRANGALARMLCDYAHERWSAARPVSPELWRPVGRVAGAAEMSDLARVLESGTEVERLAVALACRDNPNTAELLSSHADLVRRVAEEQLSWEKLLAITYHLKSDG
jgi:hypothetical protein